MIFLLEAEQSFLERHLDFESARSHLYNMIEKRKFQREYCKTFIDDFILCQRLNPYA